MFLCWILFPNVSPTVHIGAPYHALLLSLFSHLLSVQAVFLLPVYNPTIILFFTSLFTSVLFPFFLLLVFYAFVNYHWQRHLPVYRSPYTEKNTFFSGCRPRYKLVSTLRPAGALTTPPLPHSTLSITNLILMLAPFPSFWFVLHNPRYYFFFFMLLSLSSHQHRRKNRFLSAYS
jgi:hypothetical protein